MLRLYKQPLPEATTEDERDDLGTVLSEQSVLGGDAIVDALSSESADVEFSGRYPLGDYFAQLLADELEELADSSLSALPLYADDRSASSAGYYEVSSATVEPAHSAGRQIQEWQLSLTKKGTRSTHFAAVETQVSQPDPGHEFGNDLTAIVGIPASARKVQALDSTSSPAERERPEPVATVETAYGAVDQYDVETIDIEDPVLTYKLAYDQEAPTDVHVYDENGRGPKYLEGDGGRVRQWQTVYGTDHDFGGAAVIENGLLRITIDEPTNADETATLEVEQWDPDEPAPVPGTGLYGEGLYGEGLYAGTRGDWVDVDLPAYDDGAGALDTEWEPVDVDLVRIGQARVAAQVEFEATAGDQEGDVYPVDVQLERGRDALGVWETTGSLPGDLEALLAPIASTTVLDSGVEQTVVAREEVRP